MKTLASLFTLMAAAAMAQPATPKLENISQAAIQSAFQILRGEYIRSGDLTFDELNRAALQGLLQRLDLGAEVLRKVDAQRPVMEGGLLAEKITSEIGFIRPLAYAEKEAVELEKKLREFREAKLPHLILDLRSAAPPGDFSVAAAMLECFVPAGELLFKLKQIGRDEGQVYLSQKEPVWDQPLVVLIDQETNNLGETIAAVLHQRQQVLLVGGQTKGATVRYETLPLDDQWMLRFARAEMLLADDTSLFRQGLKPRFPVSLPTQAKRLLFASNGERKPLKETLFDQSRPRYNEAALVARKNPELDDYIRRSKGEPSVDAVRPLRDEVLQRAVDMLMTSSHFKAMQLDWKAGPRDARPTIKKAQRAP